MEPGTWRQAPVLFVVAEAGEHCSVGTRDAAWEATPKSPQILGQGISRVHSTRREAKTKTPWLQRLLMESKTKAPFATTRKQSLLFRSLPKDTLAGILAFDFGKAANLGECQSKFHFLED